MWNKRNLSAEEERTLAIRWRYRGDIYSRNRLVEAHDWLVKLHLLRYTKTARGLSLRDDLEQEGRLGLMKATTKFDPTMGNRFCTYASWWIKAYIGRRFFGNKNDQQTKWEQKFLSLDCPMDQEDDGFTLASAIMDPSGCPLQMLGHLDSVDRELVREALNRSTKLSSLQRLVIQSRYLLADDLVPQELISKWFGLSRQRIGQIERNGLATLKAMINTLARANEVSVFQG